jgi:hypothetical protein
MTDKERLALLNEAIAELKLTKEGYPKKLVPSTHWGQAMPKLNKLVRDLKPSPIVVPILGPVWAGGKSVLFQDLTHNTDGIARYPAFDDGWVAGRVVIAPEDLEVISPRTSSSPGEAIYCRGKSKLRYWFGHLDRSQGIGEKFAKGDAIGKIMWQPNEKSHVHVGVNIELLPGCSGKELAHHTDYTHGAPLVGVQLRSLLAP